MRAEMITCDVCQRTKQQTNHWFIAVFDPGCSKGIAFGVDGTFPGDEDALRIEDICSEECLHKRVARWTSNLNASPTATDSEAA